MILRETVVVGLVAGTGLGSQLRESLSAFAFDQLALLLAGLAAKLALEAPWGPPTRSVPGWDLAIAPLAHAAGALAGAGMALVLMAMRHKRRGA